jgi:CheY-like chemotaxis protein
VAESTPTVLIVDDSRTMRTALRMHLLPDAYSFVEAETAERGLTLARLLQPAAAVVDLHLPGMDGIDFVAALRKESSDQLRTLGVVLVTGDELEEHRERARAAGTEALLRKPLVPTVLREAVGQFVRGRSP